MVRSVCRRACWEILPESGAVRRVWQMSLGVLSVQGVSIQSISNAGGDKRGTRSSSRGEGAVDTNKSPPSTSSPVCWGYVRNVLGPIVPWCSVFVCDIGMSQTRSTNFNAHFLV
ncbi:Equilibrative nucleoside transporter 1, partial [Dissostichus eleginoides]